MMCFGRTSAVLLMLLCSAATGLRADNLEWLEKDYDFGAFTEAGGKKTGMVRFINRGSEPTVINRVRPSCGCTGADYYKELIAPGDTAWVSFTYDPAGRPGRFEKTVKVYTGATNELTSIRIRGTVIGEPTTLKSSYPFEAGPLRLASDKLELGDIRYGSARHAFITGYNQSSDTIRPSWRNTSESISLGMSPENVPPGELVTFSVYFNSRKEKELGRREFPLVIYSGSGTEESLPVSITANLTPDFSNLSASDEARAPRVSLSPDPVETGVISRSGKAPFKFTISNSGKSEMHVNRVYSASPSVEIKRYPTRIKPGKKGEVTGEIDASLISDDAFGIIVEVITDDPLHPVSTVRLAGQIKQ